MTQHQTVHVIFKTHLDIGFTDLAQNVVDRYINDFIPKAMETARYVSRGTDHPRFIWTTGSWLIHHFLRVASPDKIAEMEDAIHKGYIAWHGMPFTVHSELLDTRLLEFGLSIARRLDERFGTATISSKMTDVPGHTIAMVPILAKHGIRYLHIGVNAACTKPSVPDAFVWRNSDGSEIIVNYAGGYGGSLELPGFNHVLEFAHTNDNSGPSSPEAIEAIFDSLAKRYPGAKIQASTLDAFAEELWKVRDRLPEICEEIGDPWNHGIGSDPRKVAQYRELLRMRDQWLDEGRMTLDSEEYHEFSERLLMVPEHTWGLDFKTYLADYSNWSKTDFHAARQRDVINLEGMVDKYRHLQIFPKHARASPLTYSYYESSFQEQRGYLRTAIDALDEDKRREVESRLASLDEKPRVHPEAVAIDMYVPYRMGNYEVEFGEDGSIIKVVDSQGKTWADTDHRLGVFTYETFGPQDYEKWLDQFATSLDQHYIWVEPDLGKPGFELINPKPSHENYRPRVTTMFHYQADGLEIVQIQLSMPSYPVKYCGAPSSLWIEYRFLSDRDAIEVSLYTMNKEASRLPEAMWFSFTPIVANANRWRVDKLGQSISPLEVVHGGNRNLHGFGKGVQYQSADGLMRIESMDAVLVGPGAKRLLQFDKTFAPLDGGMHFNLYNNLYGTNFPMWFEEDALFRFTVTTESY